MPKGYTLLFSRCSVDKKASFLDYIMGGCEINVQVAIDFTLSNKAVNDPSSLHYLDA